MSEWHDWIDRVDPNNGNTPIEWDSVLKHPVAVPKDTSIEIAEEVEDIKAMLVAKNKAYGNSALAPESYLSKATAVERLAVRIDDKLNRMRQGCEFPGDDTILDLIGYLILLRIAIRKENVL